MSVPGSKQPERRAPKALRRRLSCSRRAPLRAAAVPNAMRRQLMSEFLPTPFGDKREIPIFADGTNMPRCWHSILNDYESITPAMGLMLFFYLDGRSTFPTRAASYLFQKVYDRNALSWHTCTRYKCQTRSRARPLARTQRQKGICEGTLALLSTLGDSPTSP